MVTDGGTGAFGVSPDTGTTVLCVAVSVMDWFGTKLEVTPAAREWLALTGFDPAYGARTLRRLIQREVGDALAKALLAGEIRDGDTVLVDAPPTGSVPAEPARAGLVVRRAEVEVPA